MKNFNLKTNKNSNRGITLIALVITIIVLLILAGITIAMISGQDSAPAKAVEARNANKVGEAKDAAALLITGYIQDYYNGKYVGNEAAAKNATDVGEYINAKLATAVTKGEHTFQVVSGELTVSDSNGTAIVTGTINSNGTITWSGDATNSGNSGNNSGSTTPTEPETPPAPATTATVGATTHTGTTLNLTWSKLSELAEIISNNATTIPNTTAEVTVNDGTQNYTLGVGDEMIVYYNNTAKTVRILGFNHDTLTSDTSKKAGISFEFTGVLGTAAMNPNNNNTNGWGAMPLRTSLNSTYLTALTETASGTAMSTYIKPVNKKYLSVYNSTNDSDVKTTGVDTATGDSLWLLSCSEVWNGGYQAGAYGFCNKQEGEQYKYYASKTNLTYDNGDGNSDYLGKGAWWWLRSPYYYNSLIFCGVNGGGSCGGGNANDTSGSVAPGFAI